MRIAYCKNSYFFRSHVVFENLSANTLNMKPLMLHGHERAITQIKYNRESDLLFSCAKDANPCVWYTLNGERLGSLIGHSGAVWCIDVDWTSTHVLTGSADNTCKLWNLEKGVDIATFTTKSAVRTCNFSYSGNLFMYTTDRAMSQDCEMCVYDTRDSSQMKNEVPLEIITMPRDKVTASIWAPLDEGFITGHESGDVCHWELKTRELLNRVSDHGKQVNDIQPNHNSTMFVTASKDCTSKLFDMYTLENKKTFKTERPVNSASISPLKPHVMLGGGQEAMDVTTTSTRIGKFDSRFFHLVFEEEFGRVKGHFGPINSVAFSADGKGFSTGGEDGYIRLHTFDTQYFEFDFEY